jgi:hypothetical protein
VIHSFRTFVTTSKTTQHHNPEDYEQHLHCHKNLQSKITNTDEGSVGKHISGIRNAKQKFVIGTSLSPQHISLRYPPICVLLSPAPVCMEVSPAVFLMNFFILLN